MAYFRTILKGSIGNVETWSIGITWGIFGISPDVPDQDAVDGILLRLRSWLTAANTPASLLACMSSSTSIDVIRVEKRGESEQTLSVSEGATTTTVAGTGTASKTPQDAIVLSLRTNTPGARGRGRIYWPAQGALVGTSWQLTAPVPATLIANTKTFLAGIGNEMNQYFIGIGDTRRVVLSVRSPTDHLCRNVVQLQVGNVLDTQRRRRDAIPETYFATVYP